MPNPYFKFKQFTVCHDRCAMKVGTDGVLVGAWAELPEEGRVLDLGTGTGLIALMAAQRCHAPVCGIDVDEAAVEQALENVAASPWADRIRIWKQDVREMRAETDGVFDAIVSNPPYFTEKVLCPDRQRNAARHTDGLDFDELLEAVCRLLTERGVFSVVLPSDAGRDFIGLALRHRLYLKRQTWVHTKPGIAPKRVLMAFTKELVSSSETDHLTIETEPRVHSPEYLALVKDFYLYL